MYSSFDLMRRIASPLVTAMGIRFGLPGCASSAGPAVPGGGAVRGIRRRRPQAVYNQQQMPAILDMVSVGWGVGQRDGTTVARPAISMQE